jgi:beta-glucosidase
MLQAAVESARTADVVVVFAGLTEEYESEGYDRTNMKLPDSHNALIEAAAKANPGAVVVLMGGAPVEMPWLDAVKAVLHLHLPGQAGGLAAAELLAGVVNPSGKLAESYPLVYDDVPSAGFFEQGGRQAQYREGIYVGYRYYDKAQKAVRFPFGFGLSYTTFEYADLALSAVEILPDDGLAVSLHVKNTGKAAGAEVVQLYVSHLAQPIFRPETELKEFAKVFLQPGESQQVTFTLDRRAFAVYDPSARAWVVPDGEYAVQIGASSRQIRLTANILVHGTPAPTNPAAISAWYTHPSGQPTQADFESLLGRRIEPEQPVRRGEFTIASTLRDMQGSFFIRLIVKYIEKTIARKSGGLDYSNPNFKMMVESAVNIPVRNLVVMSSGVFKASAAQGVVDIANGRLLPGIKSFLGL